MTDEESAEGGDEERVINALESAGEPLSHDEISSRLDLEPNEVGEIASDLVIENEASVNSKREYRRL